jgi:flavin reductase (DIM6/NTAB) family NADH-FMN oxidoreductase RutF
MSRGESFLFNRSTITDCLKSLQDNGWRIAMDSKKSVGVKTFWYTDMLVMPKLVTIVTTINGDGIVNAAPYSLGTPYNVVQKKPQMLLGMRKASHSCKNVIETKEFVINLPSWELMDEVMTTAQAFPKGENELLHTNLTSIPSMKVKPPSIKECSQHIECRLENIIELEAGMAFVIGNIVDIVVDEGLIALGRNERIRAIDPPIYLGDEKRKYFYFGNVGETRMIELKQPNKVKNSRAITKMPWDEEALQVIAKLPAGIVEMVIELVEDEAQKSGLNEISYDFYKGIEEQYAPKDVQERFD